VQFVGIENENNFYPEGFLGVAFESEAQGLVREWRSDQITQNPVTRLEAVAAPYRAMLALLKSKRDKDVWALERIRAAQGLIEALGYPYHRASAELDDGAIVPLLAQVADFQGRPLLWIVEAPLPPEDEILSDPLGLVFSQEQVGADEVADLDCDSPIEDQLSSGIFRQKASPRYVIVLGVAQVILIDRNKWASRSVLRFDLSAIFDRRETTTFLAMACLLSREGRTPLTGTPIAERIEEEAQRLANAVTTSLKATVRDAIEILGQEVLDVTGGKYPSGQSKGVWINGDELATESLRYMYRLLFLFFAEANPKLGLVDLNNPAYASGYSLEALRSLETVRLLTQEDRQGHYFWRSLQTTLGLFYCDEARASILRLPTVRTSLLDPESTPILNAIDLRNEAVQRIIRLLSLRKAAGGSRRISYASLGIGQLGAVYETLISFTGIVAKTDLIELKPPQGRSRVHEEDGEASEDADDEDQEDADEEGRAEETEGAERDAGGVDYHRQLRADNASRLAPTWFVERSRAGEFDTNHIVYEGANPRIIRKGSFAYRLSGRDRENSASYYTPEPLARLLVKHTLMEACKDRSADEILELKILEPAMGSAAFLVEATNQLAELYLARKQEELGQTLDQDSYVRERQRVRAYIADRNCFGVDLNPIAAELAEISLWLNSLHVKDNTDERTTFTPWFGDQLLSGNSLAGARRAAYPSAQLTTGPAAQLWHSRPPVEVGWRSERAPDHVWQFLLPASDMAKFDRDKSIRAFAEREQDRIREWRTGGFFAKMTANELGLVQHLSGVVDKLFVQVADALAKSRIAMNDEITLWPDRLMPGAVGMDHRTKRERMRFLKGERHISRSLPYQRLKTVMDAWCALWFWPLGEAANLPSRKDFLRGLQIVLEGEADGAGEVRAPTTAFDHLPDLVERMEPGAPAKDLSAAAARTADLLPETTIDRLETALPWLKIARVIAEQERFLHFDLEFADVLRARGGFDVILGNPPWLKPSWNIAAALVEIDPGIIVKRLSATKARQVTPTVLDAPERRQKFLSAYVRSKGAMAMTGSALMNPLVGAGQNNLYRCFIDLGFRNVAPKGSIGLIHQDGHLGDPGSGQFRREWYQRVVKHFNFRNEISSLMFAEVDNNLAFSANIYRGLPGPPSFDQVTSAFTALQVDECYAHDGRGDMPGLKNDVGAFDSRGHRNRIVSMDEAALKIIAAVTEAVDTDPLTARFLQPFSTDMLPILRKIADAHKLSAVVQQWQMFPIWHEVGAQGSGYIRRSVGFRVSSQDMVLSGPNFHVGNPLAKAVGPAARNNTDYETIDLSECPDDYRPRTIFAPAKDPADYRAGLPRCAWDETKAHTDHYRIAFRKMLALNGERTLIGALVPPGFAHINAIESVATQSLQDLLSLAAVGYSVIADFKTKATGQANLTTDKVAFLPFPTISDTAKSRVMRLTCLTRDYAPLWDAEAPRLQAAPWSSDDPRLAVEGPVEGPPVWSRSAGLRSEFARRLALVEIDVLVARALGWTLEELITVYRLSFPILQQNEAGTWYDQNGRIVWTCSKGLTGVGWLDENGRSPGRAAWLKLLATNPAELTCNARINFLPNGPHTVQRRFVGPFTTCDRVADYRRAWKHFDAIDAKGAP
jgi:hypothetical protein